MSKLLLHVGSGSILLPGFVNIDIEPSHKPDLAMDCFEICGRFGAGSVDGIYSCHMLEHLSYPDGAIRFLTAARNVLKFGGVLRLVVPDLYLVAKAYAAGSDLKFIYGPEFKGYYQKSESRAERFHYFMTAWEHKMAYDFELLDMLLRDAGFSQVVRCEFNQSDTPELRGIDRFESESLVVEAIK